MTLARIAVSAFTLTDGVYIAQRHASKALTVSGTVSGLLRTLIA